jgi:hypothetical protein
VLENHTVGGAPSIEYRDRQKAKTACVKIFVEKYEVGLLGLYEVGKVPPVDF